MGDLPYSERGLFSSSAACGTTVALVDVISERNVEATRIAAVVADITTLAVDAIVNAANEQLAHGGGVAAAIAKAGAPVVQEESDAWVAAHGPVLAGVAAVTGAGPMPAAMVIHVVGPRYREGQDNKGILAAAIRAALEAAEAREAHSVAFPAVAAGIFGYPPDEATSLITTTVAAWAVSHDLPAEVLLVGFDEPMANRFAQAIDALPSEAPSG